MKNGIFGMLGVLAWLACSHSEAAVIACTSRQIWHSVGEGSSLSIGGPFINRYDVDANGIADIELRSESETDPETGANTRRFTLTALPGCSFWTTASTDAAELQILSTGDVLGPTGELDRWNGGSFILTASGGFGGQYDDPYAGISEALLGYRLTINDRIHYGALSVSLFGRVFFQDPAMGEADPYEFPEFGVLGSYTESDSGVTLSIAAVPESSSVFLGMMGSVLLLHRRRSE